MTNELPGNPYGDATVEGITHVGEHVISHVGQTDATIIWQALAHLAGATMALAYEQRTANLINFSNACLRAGYGPETLDESAKRMGITNDQRQDD